MYIQGDTTNMTPNPKEILKIADSNLEGEELVKVKLARKDGKTLLYVQAHEKITDLIQQGSPRDISNSWGTEFTDNGYEFYPDNNYGSGLQAIIRDYYDSYGSSTWVKNGKVNIAPLRTKGIEDGKFFDLTDAALTEENLRKIVKGIKEVVEELKDHFLKDMVIMGEIREVEIDKTVQTAFGETGEDGE